MITDNGATPIDILIVLIRMGLFLYVLLRVMFAVIIGARNAWTIGLNDLNFKSNLHLGSPYMRHRTRPEI